MDIPEIAKALIYFVNRFPGKPAIVAEYIEGKQEYTSYFVFDGSEFKQEQGRNERSCMGRRGEQGNVFSERFLLVSASS